MSPLGGPPTGSFVCDLRTGGCWGDWRLAAAQESQNYGVSNSWKSRKGQQSCHFQRADFGLFRRLLNRVPWEAILTFKKEVLKAQPAGYAHVPKDKAKKMNNLAKEGALAGTQDEKESL